MEFESRITCLSSVSDTPYNLSLWMFLHLFYTLFSVTVTPLDVVKIRLQAQKKPFKEGQRILYRNGLMDHVLVCWSGNARTCPWYRKTAHFQLRGTLVSTSVVQNCRFEWFSLVDRPPVGIDLKYYRNGPRKL